MKTYLFALAGVLASLVACAAPTSSATSGAASDLTVTENAACTDATKDAILARALTQPITPPRYAAGLDLAGDDAWSGLHRADIDKLLCAGTNQPGDDGHTAAAWGANGEITAEFDANSKLDYIQLNAGYTAPIDFKSRPGSAFGDHTYSMKLGSPVLRDGAPFTMNWLDFDARNRALDRAVRRAYRHLRSDAAARADELPAVGALPQPRDGPDDGSAPPWAIFGARDVAFYVYFGKVDMTNATTITPTFFYLFPHPAAETQPTPPVQ